MCGVMLVFFVTSFALAMIPRNEIKRLCQGMDVIASRWRPDGIAGINVNDQPDFMTPDYYSENISDYWPGTMPGCYCETAIYLKNYRKDKGVNQKSCDDVAKARDCTDIDSTNSANLQKWKNSGSISITKMKGTSFISIYQNIDESGNCKAGFIHCGDKNSISKGTCIPSTFGRCPLTELTSEAKVGFNSTGMTGWMLYHSIGSTNNPIVEATFREDSLCFDRSKLPLSPGREKYKLLKGDYDDCDKDVDAWSVSDMGEKDFFDLNGLPHRKLRDYNSDNKYVIRFMASRTIEWSPACKDSVPSIVSKSETFKSAITAVNNLVIIYSIAFGFNILLAIASMVMLLDRNTCMYKVVMIFKLLFYLAALVPLAILLNKTSEIGKFYGELDKLKCSTNKINEFISTLNHSTEENAKYKLILSLVFLMLAFAIDCLQMCISLKCFDFFKEYTYHVRRQPANQSKASETSQEKTALKLMEEVKKTGNSEIPAMIRLRIR